MTCLSDIDILNSKYTIQHFRIRCPSSSTTKVRVVFDVSCKTANNKSLDYILYAGPKPQTDNKEIIINFSIPCNLGIK